MYTSYVKTWWRNLLKNKGYSFINIGGLALGMTVAMFIGLWIYDELSFNRYHKNYDRIAQAWMGYLNGTTGKIEGGMAVQYPVKNVLASEYSQHFTHVVRAWWPGEYAMATEETKFTKRGQFIEGAAIDMLSLTMLEGNTGSLDNINSVILSRDAAKSIFGDKDPMHKTLAINGSMEAVVTGVYENLPQNNRFAEYEFFAPFALWELSHPWIPESHGDWDNRSFITFVQIQPYATFESVNSAIHNIYDQHQLSDFYKKPFLQLIPMTTWHLFSEFKDGKPAGGRITYVWLFGIVGAFVLLLASINFINLNIARSEKRAREVGVRKAIGSGKGQLVTQFLGESFMMVALAFVISLVLLWLGLGLLNELAGKNVALPFFSPVFWIAAVVFASFTALSSGLYPALYLSSFRPVSVLKGVSRITSLSALPRKVLVVVQFSVSLILILGTIVVYKQIRHAQERPVGYDRSSLLMVSMADPAFQGKNPILRNELLNTGVVAEVSASSSPVTETWSTTGGYDWIGKDPTFNPAFATSRVTTEYGMTIGWEIVAGRDYANDFATDSISSIVINAAAAKYMGMDNAVGREITDLDELGKKKWTKTIIGVVKDVVADSPYEPVSPTLYLYRKDVSGVLNIRLDAGMSAPLALPKIKAVIEKIVPTALFEYKFVDEEYALKFAPEQRIGKLSAVFSVLAIFISCLGLFGLASFVAEQRTKEIGIRKVLGATVYNLWRLLTKEFATLVIISFFIAIPIASYSMSRWLQQYDYHTDVTGWTFALSCAGILMLALLTVTF